MTTKETLKLLAKLRETVLMDLGDLVVLNALDKAIAAYRRESEKKETAKTETTDGA